MPRVRRALLRLANVFRFNRAEDELAREVASHLSLMEDELVRKGMNSDEARLAARRAFGGVEQAKDRHRDARSFVWLDDARRDLRYAARLLVGNPGFTLVAVLTLALGIGANTAVFTVVDALLLRPPPFAHPDRLHWIYDTNGTLGVTVEQTRPPSPGNFVDWRDRTRSFDYMVAWQNWFFSLAAADGANRVSEQVRGVRVSPSFFAMLGVDAALGRTFRREEEQPGRERVALLTDHLWRRRFAGDPRVVGTTVLVDGQPFSVVGVLPASFAFLQPDFEIWLPMPVDGGFRSLRQSHSVEVLARLAQNVTLADAQSDLERVARDLQREYPATNADWSAGLKSVFPFNRNLRPMLLVLAAAVGCVLLIACINVANLLLVRAGVRQHEIAVRAAVGASRARLVRQMLTESALLTLLGSVAGLLFAVWSLRAMQPLMPQVQVLRPLSLALDARVLTFAMCTALVTAVAFGLAPALQASRTDRLRVSGPPLGRTLQGRVLSALQIAASLMLLIGATLLVRSLWNLQKIDLGFRPERVLTMQVWLPETRYAKASAVSGFDQEILRRLDQLPGVTAASVVNTRPFLGWSLGASIEIPGRAARASGEDPRVGFRIVSPGYLTTLGTPLLRGRGFTDADDQNRGAVALINQTMARRFWATEDPIGKPIRARVLGTHSSAPWWPAFTNDLFTVVGVIGDVREGEGSLSNQPEPLIYLSYLQNPSRYMHVLVRTDTTVDVANAVQQAIRRVDPSLGVYDIQTMETALERAVAEPRLTSSLLWAFAIVALLLSAVGVYGVTSYAVAQRRREFAIRMAIGAPTRSVFRMVARESLAVALAGVVAGLGGAFALGRSVASLLYGVRATDTATLMGSAGIVLLTALVASWRPAWRATRVDPMTALRAE